MSKTSRKKLGGETLADNAVTAANDAAAAAAETAAKAAETAAKAAETAAKAVEAVETAAAEAAKTAADNAAAAAETAKTAAAAAAEAAKTAAAEAAKTAAAEAAKTAAAEAAAAVKRAADAVKGAADAVKGAADAVTSAAGKLTGATGELTGATGKLTGATGKLTKATGELTGAKVVQQIENITREQSQRHVNEILLNQGLTHNEKISQIIALSGSVGDDDTVRKEVFSDNNYMIKDRNIKNLMRDIQFNIPINKNKYTKNEDQYKTKWYHTQYNITLINRQLNRYCLFVDNVKGESESILNRLRSEKEKIKDSIEKIKKDESDKQEERENDQQNQSQGDSFNKGGSKLTVRQRERIFAIHKSFLNSAKKAVRANFMLHNTFFTNRHARFMNYFNKYGNWVRSIEHDNLEMYAYHYQQYTSGTSRISEYKSKILGHIDEFNDKFKKILQEYQNNSQGEGEGEGEGEGADDSKNHLLAHRNKYIEERIALIEKLQAGYNNREKILYINKVNLIMILILDSKFLYLYILKLIVYGFIWLSIFFTEKIFTERYMKSVYAQKQSPPPLYEFYGIYLGFITGFTAFVVVVSYLIQHFLNKSPLNLTYGFNNEVILAFLADYAIFTVLSGILLVIIASVIVRKKYFKYKTEGLRGIRAYREVIVTVLAVLIMIPYFMFF